MLLFNPQITWKIFSVSGQLIETLQASAGQTSKIGDNYRARAYVIEVIQGKQK